ncbi:MarR family winged helix-turn-helix transcriptional regulator [Nocardia acididurans]|uniref:MarR family winged helix-turn-helix transcriptional regulator n=1 Tax=Nocardia acididurans TaxID=2802282 RepID=UPI0027DD06EB|nr:MarR family winged helix-turn-helix transcriptional regulator [Nocardia acididurans]
MEASDPAVIAIEQAMVAIRRSQTRRTLSRLGARGSGPALDPTLFTVLDVVEARDGEVTVTDIAGALDVDQPRASRLVSRAVAEGLLERRADQTDARRVLLHLTTSARTALAQAHAIRQAVFARTTAAWSEADRREFARLLTRFVADYQATISTPES